MIEAKWVTSATRQQVWQVLSDGWVYAAWVVGASRIRDVDPGWPEVGTRIHHSVGCWPLLINDETEAIATQPNSLLKLLARSRPLGEAIVEIELVKTGHGDNTCILIREDVISGPGKVIPSLVRQLSLVPRNRESLRRLVYLAEGRSSR
jgi:hypothetical protein